MIKNNFILNIKTFRKDNGLKQQDLADLSGISRTTLSGYETGVTEPTLFSLIKLANAMNCTIDELVGISNDSYNIKNISYKIDYDTKVIDISQDDFKKNLKALNSLLSKTQTTFEELEISKKRSDRMFDEFSISNKRTNKVFKELTIAKKQADKTLDELTLSNKKSNKMLEELTISKKRSTKILEELTTSKTHADKMLKDLNMSKKRNDLIFEDIKRTINRTSKAEEIFVDLSENLLAILDNHTDTNESTLNPSDFISSTIEKYKDEDNSINLSKLKHSLNSEIGMIYAPVSGRVACGVPTPPYTDFEEYIKLPLLAPLSDGKDYFVLHASGDSMNILITDGEQMIIERTVSIETGDRAVFLINGECTLKEFVLAGDSSCILKPLSTNPIHEDQYYESSVDLLIQGKYVCKVKDLFKKYDEIMKSNESL